MIKILILLYLSVATFSARQEDLVTELKDYYDFSKEFKMYSGYLTLQQSPLINVHYVFITSKNKPETDDLVLWSNGGPGCSSLLGFLTQLGPHLLFQGANKLAPTKNDYSWNNKANMLFLETPPGVGFSINQDKTYQFNDTRSAQDNMAAIKQWFKIFPEFSSHRFWITGQSYCGMYLPLLADQLLQNKDSILPDGKSLDFYGMMIGNGVMLTELHWRRKARNAFYSRHYHFGPEINALISHCKYTDEDTTNLLCKMGNKLVDQQTQRINPYNSIGICYVSRVPGINSKKFWYTAFDEQMYAKNDNQPCSSDHTGPTLYFNDPDVQKQLHMKQTKWQDCSEKVGSTFHKDLTTIPLFEGFKKAGLKIMLYSGNIDAQVSYVETEEYISQIGWKQVGEKKRLVNPFGSLEGWVSEYEGLTFYVVNAAGHMVPHDKPAAASRMFNWFLSKS